MRTRRRDWQAPAHGGDLCTNRFLLAGVMGWPIAIRGRRKSTITGSTRARGRSTSRSPSSPASSRRRCARCRRSASPAAISPSRTRRRRCASSTRSTGGARASARSIASSSTGRRAHRPELRRLRLRRLAARGRAAVAGGRRAGRRDRRRRRRAGDRRRAHRRRRAEIRLFNRTLGARRGARRRLRRAGRRLSLGRARRRASPAPGCSSIRRARAWSASSRSTLRWPRCPSALVADIVYAPLETPLLAAARRAGLTPVDGLGMLIHQARPAFRDWFGVMPDATPGCAR